MAGRPFLKIEIILKKFGNPKIISTFAIPIVSTFAIPIAEIAQLVEHDLAKVGVASSSLVFRSTFSLTPVGLFSYLRFQSPIHFVFIV